MNIYIICHPINGIHLFFTCSFSGNIDVSLERLEIGKALEETWAVKKVDHKERLVWLHEIRSWKFRLTRQFQMGKLKSSIQSSQSLDLIWKKLNNLKPRNKIFCNFEIIYSRKEDILQFWNHLFRKGTWRPSLI